MAPILLFHYLKRSKRSHWIFSLSFPQRFSLSSLPTRPPLSSEQHASLPTSLPSLRSFLSSLDRLAVLPEEHLLACLQAALADVQRGLTALLQATRRKQQQQQQWALQQEQQMQQQQQKMHPLGGAVRGQQGEAVLLGVGGANVGGEGPGLIEARGMRGSTEALEGLQVEDGGATGGTGAAASEQQGVMDEEEDVGGEGSAGGSGEGGLAQEGWLEDADVAVAQVTGRCDSSWNGLCFVAGWMHGQ